MNDKKKIETLHFQKWCLIFDGSAICLFTKYDIFSWVLVLIFGQNSGYFCIPPWKLDHPNFPKKSQFNKLKMKNGSSAQGRGLFSSSMQTSNMYSNSCVWVNYVGKLKNSNVLQCESNIWAGGTKRFLGFFNM